MARKGRAHAAHHGGSWKVAYADFITSMMALFLVLWLTGMVNTEKKAALAQYFKDPTIFGKGKGLMPGADRPVNFDFNKSPALRVMPFVNPDAAQQQPTAATDSIIADLKASLHEGSLWPFRDRVKVHETSEGVEVSVVDKSEEAMFAMASSTPTPKTVDILRAIARQLQKYGNHVMVGGHTDAHPYSRPDGYSNWELSSDRANRARAILQNEGLAAAKISAVRGFADTRPLDESKPLANENRRISVVVLKQ